LTASQKHGIVSQDAFMESEGRAVVRVIHGADILKHVEPNDFVISMRSFQGGLEWSALRGSISSAYVMLVPDERVLPAFFRYAFKCTPYIQALQSTSNLVRDGQAMRYENFTQIDLPLPEVDEQSAIAGFLDRETAKIDVLIEEQQRLIALLKDKRQAVFSRAVTKGLNPSVPMKDSFSHWLREVPAHWTVGKLRYFASFRTGSTPNRDVEDYWNGDIPWVKTGEVNYIEINDAEEKITSKALEDCSLSLVPAGTLLMALYGQGVTRARVALLGIPATFNQACVAIRTDNRLNNCYLRAYCIFAYPFIGELGNETTQQNLNVDLVRGIPIVIPPIKEQMAIAIFAEKRSEEFNRLIAESESAIGLLQERRSALISAAVTGKIDVRGLVADTAEVTEAAYEPA
jgi:type I restriction enzyme S subunit